MNAPVLSVRGISKQLWRHSRRQQCQLRRAQGRDSRPDRPERFRQVDAVQLHPRSACRPMAARRGQRQDRVAACAPADLNTLGVGRTFQQLSVFPKMTVLDNVILAGQEHHGTMLSRLFGTPRCRADRGGRTADRLLPPDAIYRDTLAGSLSYGQQKLVDAAMAFMAGPEPRAARRAGRRREPHHAGAVSRSACSTYNAEHGTTFVVIEHNMEFVMSCARASSCWPKANIIAEGTPEEIRANQTVIDAYLGG